MNQILPPAPPRPLAPPFEGTDGVYSQTWFPVCRSDEAEAGKVHGADFLGGRVIVMRDADGKASVLSAYCPHLGADLCTGEMIENTVRCPFHFWRYGPDGRCVTTGSGDPIPPTARLFAFPTVERYGCIFAYNGDDPSFEIPGFPDAPERLIWKTGEYEGGLPTDPWVVCCNTPDMQHIEVVHGISFDNGQPHDQVEWTDHSMLYAFNGKHRDGAPINFRVGIYGTNIYWQDGYIDGRWFGFIAPMGLPTPGNTRLFFAVAVEDDGSDPAAARAFLDAMYALEVQVATEDLPIVERARFRPGTLTRSDKSLSRFLRYLRDYPRAHPSAQFIS
ncbi:aromatic ring-hydroxylating oxygenase subunit alpha [Sphingosinicella rhizophila]|uniref:Rieske 2Fe-2S domain-containing protein n=1 Tax=Sphingosinicella rhizophila TaxID=3050082 RepID=A0ABU3Q6X5_9SPHN|nr:Rieske 2Fe-2S domain-containing protein [Sphingosinicella sp. GR2756]MDT9599141.1 Rieske 2Fe-2S domain-containing protein [Sphingosinicella sp. GR2756]